MFLFITHYFTETESPQAKRSQANCHYTLLYAEFFTVAAKMKVTYHIPIK